MKINRIILITFTISLFASLISVAETNKPWEEILKPPAANLPQPQSKIVWRLSLEKAMDEAKQENRPVFITLRCERCEQCSFFDEKVLEAGPQLAPWLKQFITVRITDASKLDFNRLPVQGFQDMDLSWWGWFLSPQGHVYSVFGGRDHVSDETRISEAALIASMKRILNHHYNPNRLEWNIDGPPYTPQPELKPMTLPGYQSWLSKRHDTSEPECLHCHQVVEILRQPAIDAGTFDKDHDLRIWPLPENVGITVDRDHGLLVESVETGSPADKTGIQPGDILAAANGRKLFNQTDFRGVLHRRPHGAGSINIKWLRDGGIHSGTLNVTDGWRKTILDWRMSVSQGNVGTGPHFWPLPAREPQRKKHSLNNSQMAIKPYFGPSPSGPAYQAGLRPGHLVIAVDGQSPNLNGRAFLVWFRMRHDPGDKTTLTILDKEGNQSTISYQLLKRETY